MAAQAAESPAGKLSDVFRSPRELDGAYDLVESKHVSTVAIGEAQGRATARRCVGSCVRVAVDGSSLRLADHEGAKDFGSVGTTKAGARGLKVISALAVGPDGVTLGVLSQVWWARGAARSGNARTKRKRRARLPTQQKETRHWVAAIEQAARQLDAVGADGWFQVDREGDAWPMLTALAATKHLFTVRSSWDRAIAAATGRDKQYLRAHLAEQRPIGSYEVDVPGSPKRTARRARMVMRATKVSLRLRDRSTSRFHALDVHAVWVREEGTVPNGEKPLDWLLLTNASAVSFANGREVVQGYATRWRIEDFHRAWKSGVCNIEDTQLRSRAAVVRWATIQAAVAARAERIKLLARGAPERPATDELSVDEIRVLIALKREEKKRTETVPDGIPTMAQATRWLADLGGYTGKSSGGPPGSITISRGLDRVVDGARAVQALARWAT